METEKKEALNGLITTLLIARQEKDKAIQGILASLLAAKKGKKGGRRTGSGRKPAPEPYTNLTVSIYNRNIDKFGGNRATIAAIKKKFNTSSKRQS